MFSFDIKKIGIGLVCVYYIWYLLPILRFIFKGNVYNLLFASVLFLGLFFILIENPSFDKKRFIHSCCPFILFYVLFILFSALLGWGNSDAYVKISVSFCLSVFVEYLLSETKNIKPLLYVIIVCFCTTFITTFSALLIDPTISRILTGATPDDEIMSTFYSRNVDTIGFVQVAAMLAPILVKKITDGNNRLWWIFLWLIDFLFMLNASFTISMIIFIFFSLISLFVYEKNVLIKIFFSLFSLFFVFFIFNADSAVQLISLIPNENISIKLGRLLSAFVDKDGSEMGARYWLYLLSLETFLHNLCGVGPYYFVNRMGIGYHSAIFDDLARFGLFGLFFFFEIALFYYRYIKSKWTFTQNKPLIILFMLEYFFFLMFNPGFRYPFESALVFFIFPNLQELSFLRSNKSS